MAPTAANAATTPFEALVYTPEGRKKRMLQSSGRLPAIWWNGFDFDIYFFCAIYFTPAFFPRSDPPRNC